MITLNFGNASDRWGSIWGVKRMRKQLLLRCLYFVICWGACSSPHFDDGKIQCGPNDACPPGYECVDNVCRSQAGKRDGGIDGRDTTAPAAPTLTSVMPASPANENAPKAIGTAE